MYRVNSGIATINASYNYYKLSLRTHGTVGQLLIEFRVVRVEQSLLTHLEPAQGQLLLHHQSGQTNTVMGYTKHSFGHFTGNRT